MLIVEDHLTGDDGGGIVDDFGTLGGHSSDDSDQPDWGDRQSLDPPSSDQEAWSDVPAEPVELGSNSGSGELVTEQPPQPTVSPVDLSTGGPKRRRQGSPVRTMIGVVLGGIMAIVLVNGILFLIGRPMVRLGFYPFDGSFDPQAVSRRSVAAPNPSVDSNPRRGRPLQGRSLAADLPDTPQGPDPAEEVARELMADANLSNPLATATENGPTDEPGDAFSSSTDGNNGSGQTDPSSPQTVVEVGGQPTAGDSADDVDDPLFGIDSLDTNVVEKANRERQIAENLQASIERWDSIRDQGESPTEMALRIYTDFSQLGALGSRDTDPMIRNLLNEVAQRQGLLRELALLAPGQIRQPAGKPDNDGAMIVGPIVNGQDGWEAKLAGGSTVAVSLPGKRPETPSGIQLGIGRIVAGSEDQQQIQLSALVPLNK